MRNFLTLFAMVLLLSACEAPKQDPKHWSNAQENYVCTKEQWATAEYQAKFCVDYTDYFGKYCLGTAIIRNCKFNEEKTK